MFAVESMCLFAVECMCLLLSACACLLLSAMCGFDAECLCPQDKAEIAALLIGHGAEVSPHPAAKCISRVQSSAVLQ